MHGKECCHRQDREPFFAVQERERRKSQKYAEDITPVIPPVCLELDDGDAREHECDNGRITTEPRLGEQVKIGCRCRAYESEQRSDEKILAYALKEKQIGNDAEKRLVHGTEPTWGIRSRQLGQRIEIDTYRFAENTGIVPERGIEKSVPDRA